MEERIFTINLGKEFRKYSRLEKSKRSVAKVRNFLKRHMKSDDIKIGSSINEEIWKKGDQSPPPKIRIKAIKTDEGVVRAELLGEVFVEEVKPKEKVEEKEK